MLSFRLSNASIIHCGSVERIAATTAVCLVCCIERSKQILSVACMLCCNGTRPMHDNTVSLCDEKESVKAEPAHR